MPADTYKKAIQPRFGFAYQLTSKLVVRGGWGRYYSNPSNAYLQNTGFNNSTSVTTSHDGGRTPILESAEQPLPDRSATASGIVARAAHFSRGAPSAS